MYGQYEKLGILHNAWVKKSLGILHKGDFLGILQNAQFRILPVT